MTDDQHTLLPEEISPDDNEAADPLRPGGWATLSGHVAYRQRMALPPNAVLTVELQDVSRMDAPATVLAASASLIGGRQVPIPFILTYNADLIEERMTYALSAKIHVDGRLAWTNTERHAVLTRGAPSDKVMIAVNQIIRPV